METTSLPLIWGLGYLAGLGLTLSLVLAAAGRWLLVPEDPRIHQLEELLPGTNCGACGQPSCRAFAQGLGLGQLQPADCNVSTEAEREVVAQFLGVEVGQRERLVARLACNGGTGVAQRAFDYQGPASCRAAAEVAGGPLVCAWGCMGYGDCQAACSFKAIEMTERGLPQVDFSRCTACGDCVQVCPKDLFRLVPVRQALWIYCRNHQEGEAALAGCDVACTACGLCVQDARPGLLTLIDHLVVMEPEAWDQGTAKAAGRCPTGAIRWRPDPQTS
ncbi:MAG: (Fe-S)-binding protein [bacterium]|nr:(Fe-S)-binding protein [bacterium]